MTHKIILGKMKPGAIYSTAIILLAFLFNSRATVFYVDAGNLSPQTPFASWATAATSIQDAIDTAGSGDTVLVTNGVYAFGGKIMAGDLMNRVALTNAITVQSVNGPWATTIQGAGTINGPAAIRCAWLTNGASLIGFTLMSGATRNTGDTASLQSGGGVWCATSNALVANCVIASNAAAANGAGVYQGTVSGSLIRSNGFGPTSAGATYKSVLKNCTIVSNSTYGALSPIAMTNCIIYYNGSPGNYSVSGTAYSHCCTTPALTGTGNFTSAPLLFADGIHLSSSSPCIAAGVNPVTGTDIFGNVWSNPPSVGCAEWTPAPLITTPTIKLTASPAGFSVGNVSLSGSGPYNFVWLKDGSPLLDNGHFSSTQSSNLMAGSVVPGDAGAYQLVVSNASGTVTSAVVQLVIHYVDAAGANPAAPYLDWTTAATNLQDAVDAALPNEVVLATNGVCGTGGRSMDGIITNRVAINKPILVQSMNGPAVSCIQGSWNPVITNGLAAIRSVWMTSGAILNGFTVRGGATRPATPSPNQSMNGGGIWGSSTNAAVVNCNITANMASFDGGGAYQATLYQCTIIGNQAWGSVFAGQGVGGGVDLCNLYNCMVANNYAGMHGGGAANGSFRNCAFTANRAIFYGSGIYLGKAYDCTVSRNASGGYGAYGGAAASCGLTNCIIYGNTNFGPGSTNYFACTFSYCDADPLPSGPGNIDIDPLLLPDGIHLAAASPILGAGDASVPFGTDIDGQPWNNPPAMGCDEWQPTPIIAVQPNFQIGTPAHGLTFNVSTAGQAPFAYAWTKDGAPIQDDGHHSSSTTANLVVNHFGPEDGGFYQVVVTNASGSVTSGVVQVVIHAVDAAGMNPVIPFSTWANAATNIQDAINAAAPGEIVLVTNGTYATGGVVMTGDLTNRVAIDKAITVMSVNGYKNTIIQGAWDSATTNGPGAVRCVWLADGAVLTGFTLQNGATRATGDGFSGGPLESGGGIEYNSTNQSAFVSNCLLTNNSAVYGGGMAFAILNNSLVINNFATFGGGAYLGTLNNCTVYNNYITSSAPSRGAGTYGSMVRNSIIVANYDAPSLNLDNYNLTFSLYSYTCTAPTKSGAGNINADPAFLDGFHISSTSPCNGTGNASYAGGYDLDDEPWNNPPSMGCDEVVVSNLVGPLSVNLAVSYEAFQTNAVINHAVFLQGTIAGLATRVEWSFGDGPTATNFGMGTIHHWTNAGDYNVTFTAYNSDHPAGVPTNASVHIEPLNTPQIQSPTLQTNGFQFQFQGQMDANYTIQYSTNLNSPAAWKTLRTILVNNQNLIQVVDSAWTNAARFYRVIAQ